MGDLVDSIVRIFEFMVQGSLTLIVIAYVLVWIHPLKRALFTHWGIAKSFMLEHLVDRPVFPKIEAALFLGAIYFLGVITNVFGYWLLQPAHKAIIDAVENRNHIIDTEKLFVLPLEHGWRARDDTTGFAAYQNYLQDEVKWRNLKLDAMRHALDPLLKQLRIVRGTAVFALTMALLALVRVAYFAVLILIFPLFPTLSHRLYLATVRPFDSKETIPEKKMRHETRVFAFTHFIYFLAAVALYIAIMLAYKTAETEYHLLASSGAKHAIELFKMEHPLK